MGTADRRREPWQITGKIGTEVVFGVSGPRANGRYSSVCARDQQARRAGAGRGPGVQNGGRILAHAALRAVAHRDDQRGPGNMNIVPAIATTYYESIAVIVLAGAGATHWFDRGGMEEAYRSGPEDWVAPCSAHHQEIVHGDAPDNVLDMFLRASHTAFRGDPGPVVFNPV